MSWQDKITNGYSRNHPPTPNAPSSDAAKQPPQLPSVSYAQVCEYLDWLDQKIAEVGADLERCSTQGLDVKAAAERVKLAAYYMAQAKFLNIIAIKKGP